MEIPAAPVTTLTALVVRHAEKVLTGIDDPGLTPEGQVRAAHLKDILARAKVDAFLATQYNRTIQTLKPSADARTLQVQGFADVPGMIAALRALPPGSTAAVAGNSFNLAEIINSLGVKETIDVPSTEYDNLWVVHFGPAAGAPAKMEHLIY